jgi:hypothetical protein
MDALGRSNQPRAGKGSSRLAEAGFFSGWIGPDWRVEEVPERRRTPTTSQPACSCLGTSPEQPCTAGRQLARCLERDATGPTAARDVGPAATET